MTPSLNPSLFDVLVLSLGNAALVGLGLMSEPGVQTTAVDLQATEYNIELLEMLQKKTRGNLSPDEQKMIDGLLYDLRLKYVDAKRRV